ncbi:TipJ family phage tail tip protein [Klebsiella michiganensis]|uniref:TipJ family phage tail tip protein n=1 Tax=Klebsiella michiganensis TaxID=1134687 RepID=UPI002FF45B6A
MTQHLIKGCKGGSSSPRTPTEQPDDLQSVAKAKILIALGEGEFAGALTAKDIYLDGTPLENSDGSQNFSGVAWEFRPGTQAQNYIQGIPGSENEINVGVEVSSKTAWSRSFSNTQLSAVRLRLKWPSLLKQEDNGDLVGNAVSYAVDLQTDGGSWQTVLESAVSGKTTSGYERCHRIDLPRATTGWVLRLRKVTVDANTSKTGDVMMLQSYAEVLDAKLRYPNTALLYVEFDSRQFNGSIPKIACSPRGLVIRVPDNYDPETRQYSGIWTGAFKWAWTDNPAWIFYDLIVSDRFGLGNRLTSENIDKWTLYQVARYCDEPVPDGKGGEGTEPRYLCNVYVQDRNDAYTVLRDFAAIFRGMTCWSGDRVIALADMPRDIDYTYTRANVINGRFHYASSSSKTRYTNALVSWSDPENEYADAMEPVFEQPLVARYGFNQLELTAIGCTRQSEANRKGRWGILTNNKDRVVSFSVGLDGNIPQPGYIIAVADEMLAGKVNGGRTREVDGCVITLDRKTEAKAGDRLLLNLPSGGTQGRTIESVDGHVVTVTAEYAERPEPECVWAIESDSLRVQQYRVVGVKDNNDSTFTISAAAHDPDKYARIDSGAIIDSRPISVIPPGKQSAPANIVVESYSVVNQGISVETLQVHWTAVKNAIAYEAQWRRNEGNWINVPRSSVASFDVSGIYAGRYIVRVRAINAAEVSSGWAYSQEKTLTGKIGLPSAPVSLTTTSLLHGVQLNWAFPEGSGDTQKTELQYSPNPTGNGAMALSDVTYPGNSYQQMGLQIAATFWYRARIVDRLGNESPWTVWVQGMASDDIGEYYDKLTDAIKDTEAWQESQRDMEETHKTLTETADAIREEVEQQVNEINQSINETAGGIRKQVDGQIATVNKSITENIDLVNQTLNDAISTVNKSINDAVSDINTSVDQQIADVNKALTAGDSALKSQLQTVENGLKQSIAQANTGWDKAVKQETADRIADVNAKAAQAADQLLNEKNERPTGWQTIVGIQGQNAAGQNSWQGAVTITESGLGERGKWVKFSGKALMNGTGRTRGVVWISTRGATGSGTPGYDLYIDDIVITDITDAQAVQTTADATASAVDSLTTKVSQQDNNISSIGNRTTVLENGLSVTNASVNKKADANTVQTLQNTVTQQGKDLSSQGNAITSLNNMVSSVKDDISKKADTAAVFALTNRVTETEQSIRSNSDAVTSLSSSLSQQARRGANVLPDGTWESYPVGYNVANNRVLVTSDEAYSGAKCIRLIRANDYNATATDNNDCHIFAGLQIRDGATYYVEFRVKPDPKGTAMADNVQLSVGFSLQDMSGSWSWPALTKAKKDLVAEGWTKVSGYLTNNRTSIKQAMVRLSVPNVSTVKAGNAFLIDDLFITEVTDAKAALDAADANALAIMNLKTTVTQNGEDITSQGSSITKLTNDLAITNGNVNKKADATALQTLQNTVTQQGKEAASQGTALTSLENSLNGLSVGGANLIRHSDTLDGWSSRSPSETYQGASVAWTRLVKGTGGYVQLDEQTLDVTGKTEFIYSFYAKGAYAAQEMTAYFYNPSNTSRIETNQGYKSSAGDGAAQFTLTTSWQRYWVRWVIPATAGTKRLIPARLQHAPSADKEVWLCRPKLETGNVVTDWTPNNDDIAAEIQANAGAVQNLSTRVTTAEGKITSSGTAITRLQNDLALTQADVSKKADTTSLQTVQNSVTQQDKDITAANSAITKLTSDLSTTNANVSKKADASALQTLQNTITQQGETLTTQGSAIVSLENSLNALDVGGANQIPDSGSLVRYGNVSTDKYNGNGVMAFTLKAGAAYRDLISINLSAPVDGTEYVLSFYAKAAINGQKVRSHFYSPNSTKKAVSSQGNTFTNSDGLCDFTLTTEWQRYWVKWTQGAGTGSKKLIVARIQQGSTDQTVYLSSPKFERGNVPTAWSEAPEDNASAAAVSALTSRVDSAEGVLTSQGQLLTSLQNGLTTADQNIGKKADSSAVNTLTNRVSQVENTLTTQSESITSLSGNISTLRNQVSNPWFDGSLESYADGQQISGSGAIVTTAQKFNGSRSLRLRREANNGGNSDKQIGPWSSIRENAVYSVELWAMMPADQSPSTGWQTIVGIQGQNAAGQNSWQGAVTITESGLGERGKWVKFSGKALMNGTGRTRGVVWISTRGATGSGTPGYDLYIDDIVITDVTDAQTALDVADASTTAVSGLTTRVTNAETKITAHSQQITSLQSSLSGKADAGALNTLSSRVTSAEGKIESTASGLTSLNSTVGSLSSTVQAQGQTLSDTNGKVNSTYSIKVETNNGKKVGAGIVLGSDGSTSDMILYADRFSLFNRNSKAAVPVMIAEGNDLYIDSARIKNGTIDIAKITDRLSSTNYVAGWRGWSITKSGSSEFNNVVVRGEIQADTGTLNNVVINESCNILGTVRANKIIGDVGSWAINIAQHRSRRIAKAQWAWFDLLAVDRQPFEQRVQLLGALRQDDSINITGGGKLTAGMEYKSYEGGSLSMGKLGYCILMLGTGDTSGGGPMTCALSIDGVLYKQENYSMEIQSMDFIVPPGTGQTVVRYGYYLDRNGGMTGVILSRFHAFVMRNSNIIRGVSSD